MGRFGPIFGTLCALRAFERRHLAFLRTSEDRDLVCEIGRHQAAGTPLTVKQALLLGVGSVPTVQRRLRALRRAGALVARRHHEDHRAVELRLTPRMLKTLERYAALVRGDHGVR